MEPRKGWGSPLPEQAGSCLVGDTVFKQPVPILPAWGWGGVHPKLGLRQGWTSACSHMHVSPVEGVSDPFRMGPLGL